jgi:hypothetical protein
MPESIGSKRRVLPPGVVCDKCNNYFAREVEEPVLNHPSMRNIRAWHQVPNKRRNVPSFHGNIDGTDIAVGFRRGRDGKLEIEPEKQRNQDLVAAEWKAGLPNGFIFVVDLDPPKREMSRFQCKMAMETVAELFAHNMGCTEALVDESHFGNIRTYVRHGNNFTEWPYSQRRISRNDVDASLRNKEVGSCWLRLHSICDEALQNALCVLPLWCRVRSQCRWSLISWLRRMARRPRIH